MENLETLFQMKKPPTAPEETKFDVYYGDESALGSLRGSA
jgi:hypothetical protein